jgi:GDSL-like lipase/acylhydrolase family protein
VLDSRPFVLRIAFMKGLLAPPLRPALAALLAGLLIAVWQKVWSHGVQIELISLAILVAPLAYKAWETRRAGAHLPKAVFVLWLLAFGGAHNSTLSRWLLCAAVLALCPLLFRDEKRDEAPAGLLGWLSIPALGLGTALMWQAVQLPILAAKLYFAACLLALFEALAPWRVKTRNAAFRRVALGSVAAAFALPALVRNTDLHFLLLFVPALITLAACSRALLTGNLDRRAARKRMVRVAAPLFMLGFLLLVMFGVAEILLRATGHPLTKVPTPHQGSTWHQPHGLHHYQGPVFGGPAPHNSFRWNSWGLADFERTKAKKPGHKRILVIGDSYVEGVQVPLEAHYHVVLEKQLASKLDHPLETLAIGWAGWGQAAELRALKGEQENVDFPPGMDLSPDLVIVEFLPGNDVRNNHDELERMCNGEAASELWMTSNKAIESRLFSIALLIRKFDQAMRNASGKREHIDSGVYQVTPNREPELWAEAWTNTKSLLGEIRDLCRSKDAELLVVSFCGAHEVSQQAPPGVDFDLPAARVKRMCEELGIPFYDTASVIREAAKGGSVSYQHDGHWNERGHEAAATGTAKFIAEHPQLKSRLERRD